MCMGICFFLMTFIYSMAQELGSHIKMYVRFINLMSLGTFILELLM